MNQTTKPNSTCVKSTETPFITLREKLKWKGEKASRFATVLKGQAEITSGKAARVTCYFFVGEAVWYAVEAYLDGDSKEATQASQIVVKAATDYFYGNWRNLQATEKGNIGHEAWKPFCLWYDEVMESLPFAAALSDWESLNRLAAYPPNNKLPEPGEAKGETAWGWALITFLRGEPRKKVEEFLSKAEGDRAKRPKLLCPVLRALLDNNSENFEETLLAYLNYYRKSEFKMNIGKILCFQGTTLYHLGRKQGLKVNLPERLVDHIIILK